MNATIGKPRRDEQGRVGVAVHLHLESGGWDAHPSFVTHGMLPESVKAERDRLAAVHDRKAAKLTELRQLVGSSIGHGFTITDATILTAGPSHELLCRATDGQQRIEIRTHFNDPFEVPSDLILAMRALANGAAARRLDDERHAAAIARLLT